MVSAPFPWCTQSSSRLFVANAHRLWEFLARATHYQKDYFCGHMCTAPNALPYPLSESLPLCGLYE